MSRPIRSSFPELHPKSKGTARTLSFSISWAEKFFNVEPWPMYMYASISEKTLRISGKLKFVKTSEIIFLKGAFSKPSGNYILASIFYFLSYSSYICILRKLNIVLLFKKHKMVHFKRRIDNNVILNT